MKTSKFLIVLFTLFVFACAGNKSENDHGHEHGPDTHEHSQEEADNHDHGTGEDQHTHEQEEFTVGEDEGEEANDSTHTHDDGSTHHNH